MTIVFDPVKRSPGHRQHARLGALLDWVFLGGSDVEVLEEEEGSIAAERPEAQEKFKSSFSESGMKSFFAISRECRSMVRIEPASVRTKFGPAVSEDGYSNRQPSEGFSKTRNGGLGP